MTRIHEADGFTHRQRMLAMRGHQEVRLQLSGQALDFMQNFATLTEDGRLIDITQQYCLGVEPAKSDTFHTFECKYPGEERGIDLPSWLYAGQALVPANVRVIFDVTDTHEISYGFMPVDVEDTGQELMLAISNPRDVAKASWQLVINWGDDGMDYSIMGVAFETPPYDSEVILPADKGMTWDNNANFAEIVGAISHALGPVIFERP